LLDPVETAHGETEVKDDERKSHHQNGKVARHSLRNSFDVTIFRNKKKSVESIGLPTQWLHCCMWV
jgi:hypothetical protein